MSGKGGDVELPLSDIDTGVGPTGFPDFWNSTAVVLPGETAAVGPLLHRYFQGYTMAGQVSLVLQGHVTRDPRGFLSFEGEVTGLSSLYNFERRGEGDRTWLQEKATTVGRQLKHFGAKDFMIRYLGSRRVTYHGVQE
jgi:hypothetical protein